MKILVIGHARHGKDTFCEVGKSMGFSYQSSSKILAPEIYEDMFKHNYHNWMACWQDRVHHRASWKEWITDYNTPDKSRLLRRILQDNDIYNGMRCNIELEASRPHVDLIIWIDACERVEPEDSSSMLLTRDMAHIIVDNNGTEHEFMMKSMTVFEALRKSIPVHD
jgi:hypothetical protein